jgi:hypothetical protein
MGQKYFNFYAIIMVNITKWGKTKQWLNQEQEAFSQLYVSWDKDFFGNWVQCYIEVYWPDISKKNWYKTACSRASQLLSNVKVINRINELLEEWWMNDTNVDKQLLFLISQYTDFGNKLWAIKEYNKLKKRIDNKLELIVNVISEDELDE